MPVLGDEFLSPVQVVAEQQVEHPARLLRIGRQHPDQAPRRGFIVVRFIMSGSFSPRPFDRWIVNFWPFSFSRNSSFSRSVNAK